MTEQPLLNILVHYSENRGDHAADVAMALKPVRGESLEEMVARAYSAIGPHNKTVDVIEVRLCIQ